MQGVHSLDKLKKPKKKKKEKKDEEKERCISRQNVLAYLFEVTG